MPMTAVPPSRSRVVSALENAGLWVVGHASRLWPFVALAVVLGMSWQAVRAIHPRDFSTALHALDRRWLLLAAVVTAVNIGAMGLYDVVAFRHTRSHWRDRWRYGAVCFAWSNFLTLGPLAGPAMRFWLYRPAVDQVSDLHEGVVSIAVAFTSGLAGWMAAALLASRWHIGTAAAAGLALVFSLLTVVAAQAVISRRAEGTPAGRRWQAPVLATIGWMDWLLACAAFVACLRATGEVSGWAALGETFFTGQVIGVLSLVPGGFGSSDAFWVSRLPLVESRAAAVLIAYRVVYYILPWAAASLLLLSWVTRRLTTRIEMARRIVASLVGGGGVLILVSSASPALYARLPLLEQFVPLPLVEIGHFAAALAGLLLLVLARGLSRGYRAAFRVTLILLTVAASGALLKGFDWEEAVVLGILLAGTWSQAALFDRPSHGDWVEGPDIAVGATALVLFVLFGLVSHRVGPDTMERLSHIGYRVQAPRFLRTAGSMLLAVSAGAVYVLLRAPVRFRRPDSREIRDVLDLHARLGGSGTTPMMVAVGDKSVFVDGDRGFCLYRTIGPYVIVFSEPVVRSASERTAFLDAFFAFAGELDRRPVFYQISLDWIPVLHDRGYDFFKLGEEAHVPLESVTLDGHAGKMYRQILRRGERDGVTFRVLPRDEVPAHLDELEAISNEWLQTKGLAERQFSIGYFDRAYLSMFPCALVEESAAPHRILAFANLLEGPRGELSVDLMRHRRDGPKVMDFLFVSLFMRGKSLGYSRFNLGMAPLASVGDKRGAHLRERLARVLFQRGEQWYNFQGLRSYKDKFDPEWVPRYMAYQDAWEWPVAIAYASALIAGGWGSILTPPVAEPGVRDPIGPPEPARA